MHFISQVPKCRRPFPTKGISWFKFTGKLQRMRAWEKEKGFLFPQHCSLWRARHVLQQPFVRSDSSSHGWSEQGPFSACVYSTLAYTCERAWSWKQLSLILWHIHRFSLGREGIKKTSVEAYFSPAAITPLSLAANRVNDLCQPVSAADIGKSEIIVGLCESAYFGSKLSITHCTLQCIIAICARSIIVMRAWSSFWRQAVSPFPPLSNWEA